MKTKPPLMAAILFVFVSSLAGEPNQSPEQAAAPALPGPTDQASLELMKKNKKDYCSYLVDVEAKFLDDCVREWKALQEPPQELLASKIAESQKRKAIVMQVFEAMKTQKEDLRSGQKSYGGNKGFEEDKHRGAADRLKGSFDAPPDGSSDKIDPPINARTFPAWLAPADAKVGLELWLPAENERLRQDKYLGAVPDDPKKREDFCAQEENRQTCARRAEIDKTIVANKVRLQALSRVSNADEFAAFLGEGWQRASQVSESQAPAWVRNVSQDSPEGAAAAGFKPRQTSRDLNIAVAAPVVERHPEKGGFPGAGLLMGLAIGGISLGAAWSKARAKWSSTTGSDEKAAWKQVGVEDADALKTKTVEADRQAVSAKAASDAAAQAARPRAISDDERRKSLTDDWIRETSSDGKGGRTVLLSDYLASRYNNGAALARWSDPVAEDLYNSMKAVGK